MQSSEYNSRRKSYEQFPFFWGCKFEFHLKVSFLSLSVFFFKFIETISNIVTTFVYISYITIYNNAFETFLVVFVVPQVKKFLD